MHSVISAGSSADEKIKPLIHTLADVVTHVVCYLVEHILIEVSLVLPLLLLLFGFIISLFRFSACDRFKNIFILFLPRRWINTPSVRCCTVFRRVEMQSFRFHRQTGSLLWLQERKDHHHPCTKESGLYIHMCHSINIIPKPFFLPDIRKRTANLQCASACVHIYVSIYSA